MKRWQEPFLGIKELPYDLSNFEIGHFFTFEGEELKAIRSRRTNQNKLAAAIHLGFIKATGTQLNAFDMLPRKLISHLRTHLKIDTLDPASLRSLYQRRPTLFDHQNWAAEVLGFKPFTGGRRGALRIALHQESRLSPSVDLLVGFAKRWLYEKQILIPGQRTLRDLARTAHATTENDMLEKVKASVPQRLRKRWYDELFEEHPPYQSKLAWLQRPPRAQRQLFFD